jgi:predicted RNA-binding Zn-ribbon protein involved in translation (DUF1610 family)
MTKKVATRPAAVKTQGRPPKERANRSETTESKVVSADRLGAIQCPSCGRNVHLRVKRVTKAGERHGECPMCGAAVGATPQPSTMVARVRLR